MSTERFKMSIFAGIILRKENQILLMKRSQSVSHGGLYSIPGGGVDGLETLPSAAVREAYEELGVIINAQDLKLVHILHHKTPEQLEYISFFFETEIWQNKPVVMEPTKCDEMAWFDVDALPEPMGKSHAQALVMIAQHIMLSDFGWQK